MTASDLITLIKCIGITAIGAVILIVILIARAPEYPDDDGEHL